MLILLGALGGGYLLLCGLLFFMQRAILFPAPTTLDAPPPSLTRFDVPNGTFLLMRNVEGAGPVVVRFHGNGEQVAWTEGESNFWAQQGVSFVAVEYPGYPGTKGEPSERAIVDASEAALKFLTEDQKIDRSRLVLEGQSLGSGVAVQLVDRGWGAKLILLTPYTSITDVGARAFPYFPVRLLIRDAFDSATRAPAVKIPTLVIHGTNDEVIPFDIGKTLASKISGAQFMEVQGGTHNDLWAYVEVKKALGEFVAAR